MECWIKLNNSIGEGPAYLPMDMGVQQIHCGPTFRKSFTSPKTSDCVVLYQSINGIPKVVSHLLKFYDHGVYHTQTYTDYPWTRNVEVLRQLDMGNIPEDPITIERLLNVDSPINVMAGFVTRPATYNTDMSNNTFLLNIVRLLTPDNGYLITPT